MLRSINPEPDSMDGADDTPITPLSRRGFGKRLLLGASAMAILLAGSKREDAQAAVGDPWILGGNTIATNGTEFLGTTNVAPLIFKTAATANTPLERMRITPEGNVGIGMTTPGAKLQVYSTTYAIYARHTAQTGTHPAVHGETAATVAGASGVLGKVISTAPDTDSAGVLGQNSGTNGKGAGVRGTHAGGGYGVHGTSTNGYGVYGNGDYVGVYGSGSSYGVIAQANGSASSGVYASGSATGVFGSGSTYGVRGSGTTYGVYGRGTTGVYGTSTTGTGVFGTSSASNGVFGTTSNASSAGVWGTAPKYGVLGRASGATGLNYGVYGGTNSAEGYAGYFYGNARVTGTLSKGGGAFKIDHPLDPENKNLYHSFVESPDMMNVYNGNVTTDANGDATVELPDWFEALNRDFRYQLTVMGQFAQAIIADKIKGNQFTIKTDKPNVEVSWQVTGIRQDAFANANRIPVEEDKPAEERGKYLHPKEHGKSESAGVDAERVKKLHENNPKPGPEPQGPQRNPPQN